MDDLIGIMYWLQNWILKEPRYFNLDTLENPGWNLKVDLKIDELDVVDKILISFNETDLSWYYCCTNNKRFEGRGGPYNLTDIFYVLRQFINCEDITKPVHQFSNPINPIVWLQDWYFCQCDKDWEHRYGILIQTNESGWYVRIDLMETESEDLFEELETIRQSEDNWISYSVEKSVFEAFCTPLNLFEVINIFTDLVESPELDF